jgi:hypothetical protein
MTELKKLISDEFLPMLAPDNFVLYKNNLIQQPVNHLLKGFCFDKGNHLYVHLFVQPLYVPSEFQYLSFGWRLSGTGKYGEMFLLDDESMEYTKSEIGRLIQQEKDLLLSIKTPLDFFNTFLLGDLKLLQSKSKDMNYQQGLACTQAYIYPEKACAIVDRFFKNWDSADRKELPWMQQIKNNMMLLKDACSSKEQVHALLSNWKEFTIKHLELSKYCLLDK